MTTKRKPIAKKAKVKIVAKRRNKIVVSGKKYSEAIGRLYRQEVVDIERFLEYTKKD